MLTSSSPCSELAITFPASPSFPGHARIGSSVFCREPVLQSLRVVVTGRRAMRRSALVLPMQSEGAALSLVPSAVCHARRRDQECTATPSPATSFPPSPLLLSAASHPSPTTSVEDIFATLPRISSLPHPPDAHQLPLTAAGTIASCKPKTMNPSDTIPPRLRSRQGDWEGAGVAVKERARLVRYETIELAPPLPLTNALSWPVRKRSFCFPSRANLCVV